MLNVLARLRVPVIAVLHTVLSAPTPGQRRVLETVVEHADTVVTMSEAAKSRLLAGYLVERPEEVVVVPHGAVAAARSGRGRAGGRRARPLILTWGLPGRGKGIEWGIAALGGLRDLHPRYLVAGQTHPKVLAQEDESYRTDLRDRAAARGVADLLEFDPTYLDAEELAHLVAWADVVLAPLRLLRAGHVGCAGRGARGVPPRCRHGVPAAVELLASGADLLVPHRDPAAIAAALRRVLTEPGLS